MSADLQKEINSLKNSLELKREAYDYVCKQNMELTKQLEVLNTEAELMRTIILDAMKQEGKK